MSALYLHVVNLLTRLLFDIVSLDEALTFGGDQIQLDVISNLSTVVCKLKFNKSYGTSLEIGCPLFSQLIVVDLVAIEPASTQFQLTGFHNSGLISSNCMM